MIKFWRVRDLPYGVFSNFAQAEIRLDGKKWKTIEHFYQAQKTLDAEIKESIRLAKSPKKAKQIAQEVDLRLDWEAVKIEIMKVALFAKFRQHKSFGDLLVSTGTEELVEASPYDAIWGSGPDGDGQNLLGKTLMQVREALQNEYNVHKE